MDFDIISFILGAASGVVVAAAVARTKFAVLQENLRSARDSVQAHARAAANKK